MADCHKYCLISAGYAYFLESLSEWACARENEQSGVKTTVFDARGALTPLDPERIRSYICAALGPFCSGPVTLPVPVRAIAKVRSARPFHCYGNIRSALWVNPWLSLSRPRKRRPSINTWAAILSLSPVSVIFAIFLPAEAPNRWIRKSVRARPL